MRGMKNDLRHNTQTLAFPAGYLLNLLSCLLTVFCYPCPLVVFWFPDTYFHMLSSFPTMRHESREAEKKMVKEEMRVKSEHQRLERHGQPTVSQVVSPPLALQINRSCSAFLHPNSWPDTWAVPLKATWSFRMLVVSWCNANMHQLLALHICLLKQDSEDIHIADKNQSIIYFIYYLSCPCEHLWHFLVLCASYLHEKKSIWAVVPLEIRWLRCICICHYC